MDPLLDSLRLVGVVIQWITDTVYEREVNTPQEGVEGIPCLRGVLLSQSRVLGWGQNDQTVSFLIEASLWPGHRGYEADDKRNWGRACYKPATLIFSGIERVQGLPAPPVTGSPRYYGHLQLEVKPWGYLVLCAWGPVTIRGGTVSFLVGTAM